MKMGVGHQTRLFPYQMSIRQSMPDKVEQVTAFSGFYDLKLGKKKIGKMQ